MPEENHRGFHHRYVGISFDNGHQNLVVVYFTLNRAHLCTISLDRVFLMIAVKCRRCTSVNLQPHGHTTSGQQKYHWKACHFYGTLDTKEAEWEAQRQLVTPCHLERLSQRAMARLTGTSRSTIIKILTKKFFNRLPTP